MTNNQRILIFTLIILALGFFSSHNNTFTGKATDIPLALVTNIANPPSVPSGLSANLVPDSKGFRCSIVQLHWNKATDFSGTGIKKYNVYRDGKFLTFSNRIASADNHFLVSNTPYRYQVSAVDNTGQESALSRELVFTTLPCQEAGHLGKLPVAVILVKFADFPDEPFNKAHARDLIFDNPLSISNYYKEASYGLQGITGDVYGWYQLSGGASDYCTRKIFQNSIDRFLWYSCDTRAISKEALKLSSADFDVSLFRQRIFFVNGMGTVGLSGGLNSYYSATWIKESGGSVIIHELGHSFGGMHAGSWKCPNLVGPDVDNVQAGSCSVVRYGDPYDPMGVRFRHMNAFHKEIMGFLKPNQIAIANGPGEYILDALEIPSNGVKQLRIPLDEFSRFPNTFYFLEYRKPVGIDALKIRAPDVEDGVQIRLHRDRNTIGLDSNGVPIRVGSDSDTLYIFTTINPGNIFNDQFRNIRIEVLEKTGNQVRIMVQGVGIPNCGDRIITGNEVCDIGNDGRPGTSDDVLNGETCSSQVSGTTGELFCSNNCFSFDTLQCKGVSICSDGKLDLLVEECDDSNAINGDGCSSECKVEGGWVCDNGSPTICELIGSTCNDVDNDNFDTCNIGDIGDDGNEKDCDDNDVLEHPGQTWFIDADNDLFSDGKAIVQCERPVNHKTNDELKDNRIDCNDNPDSGFNINPIAIEICTDKLDNNCNNECDFDSNICAHGDVVCPISILGITVDNENPLENTNIHVDCQSSVANVNSISAIIDGNICSFENWINNNARFTCNSGSRGNKIILCKVDESKSYSEGNPQIIAINVLPSDCSGNIIENTCNSDIRCEWCNECNGNEFSQGPNRCVPVGECKYSCTLNECNAQCDITNGGFEVQIFCDDKCVDGNLFIRQDVFNTCLESCIPTKNICGQGIQQSCGGIECSEVYPNTIGSCNNLCRSDSDFSNGIDDFCQNCVLDFNLDCSCAENHFNFNQDQNDGCEAFCIPSEEICDNLDNDCDGDIDEGNICTECIIDSDCIDNNACNGIETCSQGNCIEGTPLKCDNGLFCDGIETCNPNMGCENGQPMDCNDGVSCTSDRCNEELDKCDNLPDNTICTFPGQTCDVASFNGCGFVQDCKDVDLDGLFEFNANTCTAGKDYCPFTNNTFFIENPNEFSNYIPEAGAYNITLDINNTNIFDFADFDIELENIGGLRFRENVDLIRINETGCFEKLDFNLDSFVKVEEKKIFVNSSYHKEFNRQAIITFFNIGFTEPKVLRDGILCSVCNIISYSNNVLTVEVPGFSTYTVEEGFTPSGGGSSGGGRRITIIEEITTLEECNEQWLCYDWDACVNGIQNRECYDLNDCSTTNLKPTLEKECVEEEIILTEEITTGDKRNNLYLYIILVIIVVLIITIEEVIRRRIKVDK